MWQRYMCIEVHLEKDSHCAAGMSGVQLKQLLFWAFGVKRKGAAVTNISSLTLKNTFTFTDINTNTHMNNITVYISQLNQPV